MKRLAAFSALVMATALMLELAPRSEAQTPSGSGGVELRLQESDSLLARRTEVKDAHDRYANQEVAYARAPELSSIQLQTQMSQRQQAIQLSTSTTKKRGGCSICRNVGK